MCGIAGVVNSKISSDLLESKGKDMISALIHRGPDSEGIWIDEECSLVIAHRRLAIQDLSTSGQQPMHSNSKRYCVVFNGEIYNFKEIAENLKNCGHNFSGHSDTEVLLAAIEEWGVEKAVKVSVGMFAFALWDLKERTLYLCRDRMGEKPLYYGWIEDDFFFSSELKAIERVVSKDKLKIDYTALSGFLQYGYISAPYSIYQKIYKLLPGTILTLPLRADFNVDQYSPCPDETLFSPKAYWSVLDSASNGLSSLIESEFEAIEELDVMLRGTVNRQMIADVKVGTFLSGGIDSSVVTAVSAHESSTKIKTYTIGFSEKEYDESQYAEKIARHLGTDHLTMRVTPLDALNVVPDLAAIYDEPFADSSQIPSYLVSRLAREHVTVCLSGDGGDELFAGYNRYLWTQSLWSKLSPLPYPLRRMAGKALAAPSPGFWDAAYQRLSSVSSDAGSSQKLMGLKIQKLAGFMQQQDITQAYNYLMSYWHSPRKIIANAIPEQNMAKGLNQRVSDEFINQAMFMDQIDYLPGDNLTKVDRASMAVSLETRLPLLSHEMIELAWRIPVSMKVKNNVSKWALREVLYKYVPREMIDRPKMGFSVPVASWLRGELRGWAEDLLSTINTSGGGVLAERPIMSVWEEHISGKRDHSHRLWTVLMFLSWANHRR